MTRRPGARAPGIPKRPIHQSAPLSCAQLQMWLMDRMTPGNPAYVLPVAYRLKGDLDPRALEDSFNRIIERHEVLRTTFAVVDDEPLQVIHPKCRIRIRVVQLDQVPAAEREIRLHDLVAREARSPFDLSRLPLVRVVLFKLDEAEHVLLVTFHHTVADGVSVGLMLDELDTFYRGLTGAGRPHLPDLPRQYADYASWQRHALVTESHVEQIAFWRQRLSGRLPVLELPCDLIRPAVQSFKGSNVFFEIPSTSIQSLAALGAREGCTLFMTLLAAFQILLQRYSGAEDILIGTPVSVRTPADVRPLIGNFLNMVALRCDLTGNPTFVQVLRRTRRTTLRAFSRADLPFERVVESLTFERDPARNPIFQVMFDVLPAVRSHVGDLDVSSFRFDLGTAQFDLSLHVSEESGRHTCQLEYCADLFNAGTIQRMSANFVQLLSAIVTRPDERLLGIPILAESERRQVLFDWNRTTRPCADVCLHDLFERMVEAAPDRVAVKCGGRSLTYGDLNVRANRLANHLIELGVESEEPVGVHLERSMDLVVALLAILKAGAAYVPLDPTFPPARLALMVDEARMSIMVSQSDLIDRLPASRRRMVCLDRDERGIRKRSASNPDLPRHSSSLAYIIYTSGSSGRPKGVTVEHRSLVNLLTSMQREPGFSRDDVLLAVTTVSFDIAALEIFLPLVSGGTVVIADRNEAVESPGSRDNKGQLATITKGSR